ncbi:two component transcriptional regulator, winged helix family [Thermincola potens JR]|uniref:Stage 0 sporulation protein A homolog n=1 Tax=Thermincola potens (strain JR) TaxID=635013 RepID=D5XA24_THEPJ|nr:two component transcriptional regulator, winged helix family [Thermincola potens JR]
MAKILIVDDEHHIIELVRFVLQKEGFDVKVAQDGLTAIKETENYRPDLILLDLMLPGIDGLEVCRTLRKKPETADIPVIMVTAKSDEMDKIIGLELGADDYVTKPFSPRELVARVKARLRRRTGLIKHADRKVEEEIAYGPLVVRPARYEVFLNGEKLDLTLKEYELLVLLINNPGKVFSRDFLLSTIWGFDYTSDTRTVDVHIYHLRQKIERDPSQPGFIETVRGVGYRFKELA